MNNVKNYHVKNLDGSKENIMISVCGPLKYFEGAKPNTECPMHSAVCLQDHNHQWKSLGTPNRSPYLTPGGSDIVLKYENGSICDPKSKAKLSSTITFKCDQTEYPGYPVADKSSQEHNCNRKFFGIPYWRVRMRQYLRTIVIKKMRV